MKMTTFQMKFSAMLVAIPRYVGLMLFLTGFSFTGWALDSLHIAEAVAGLALAVLEGFAVSHIFSNIQRQASPVVQWLAGLIGSALLILLPVCSTPYLMELFRGSAWFVQASPEWLQVAWVLATASMPVLIIAGVSLVEQEPAKPQTLPDPDQLTADPDQNKSDPDQTLPSHSCAHCGKTFSSPAGLNGHKRHCKG